MKLKELNQDDRFTLCRNGEKYTVLCKQCSRVMISVRNDTKKITTTLNLQCEIKLRNGDNND